MCKAPDDQRKIQIFLQGLVILFISPDNRECTIGLVSDAPAHHNLQVAVLKRRAGGPFEDVNTLGDDDLEGELRLNVTGTSQTGIRRCPATDPIDRFTGLGTPEAFDWIFHFERDFYHRTIGARRAGFRSLITINNGEIFTHEISKNHLQFRQGNSGYWVDFGHVAVVTGVEIVLDGPQSAASLTNGRDVIFDTEPDISYQVNVDRGDDGTHPPGNDADHFFTVMGPGLSQEERLHFRSFPSLDPTLPSTPDAACLNGGSEGPIS